MPLRVALVDDHTLIRDALAALLSAEEDIRVVAAVGSVAEALCVAAHAAPDVLLLDIALPDGTGLEAISEICRRSPSTHVIVLSMHAEPEHAAAALERGACGLISKDASPEALLAAVRRAAQGVPLPVEKPLTRRERKLLTLIAGGAANEEMGAVLGVRAKTVEAYVQRLMDKLAVHTRAGLVGYARRLRL